MAIYDQGVVVDLEGEYHDPYVDLGQFPGETKEPSRVSAFLVDLAGSAIIGEKAKTIPVTAVDAVSGAPLGDPKTADPEGYVTWDVGFSNKAVIIRPRPPAGLISIPEEALVKSLPLSGWFRDLWGKDESKLFVIAKPGEAPPSEKKDEKKNFWTIQNIVIIVAIAAAGYLLYQHFAAKD